MFKTYFHCCTLLILCLHKTFQKLTGKCELLSTSLPLKTQHCSAVAMASEKTKQNKNRCNQKSLRESVHTVIAQRLKFIVIIDSFNVFGSRSAQRHTHRIHIERFDCFHPSTVVHEKKNIKNVQKSHNVNPNIDPDPERKQITSVCNLLKSGDMFLRYTKQTDKLAANTTYLAEVTSLCVSVCQKENI